MRGIRALLFPNCSQVFRVNTSVETICDRRAGRCLTFLRFPLGSQDQGGHAPCSTTTKNNLESICGFPRSTCDLHRNPCLFDKGPARLVPTANGGLSYSPRPGHQSLSGRQAFTEATKPPALPEDTYFRRRKLSFLQQDLAMSAKDSDLATLRSGGAPTGDFHKINANRNIQFRLTNNACL